MGDVIEVLTTATNTVEVEAAGPQGIPGVGVPTGGSALQILRKKTGTDYDTEWAAAGAGSGSVTSVALASSEFTITGSPITDSGTITVGVAANALTLNKLETINTAHFLGRHGSGAGDVQPVSASQARTILNVADGAEVNVQSNWTEADSGSDAFILNKPTSLTPTAHAASHAAGGSDPLDAGDLSSDGAAFANMAPMSDGLGGITWAVLDSATNIGVSAGDIQIGDQGWNNIPADDSLLAVFGQIDTNFAPVSHTHGNLTNDGKVGTTSGLPLKTGTAGVVEAGAFGTSAGQFAEGNHTHTQLHDRSHAITSTSDHTAGTHKIFYSDASGNVQELALGATGTVLTSGGTATPPSFAAASGGASIMQSIAVGFVLN